MYIKAMRVTTYLAVGAGASRGVAAIAGTGVGARGVG